MMASIILSVGVCIFATYLFKIIFDKTGIPDVLMLMLCGIALGPILGYVSPSDFGKAGGALATMALVLILFESGIDLDLASLRSSVAATLKITLSTFLLTAGIVTAAGIALLGLSLNAALMTGILLGGTSSAVVIPLVQGLRLEGQARTILILESALTDVLCIVGIYTLIEASREGSQSLLDIAASVFKMMIAAGVIGAIAGFLWLLLLRVLRRMQHGRFASAAASFIVYSAIELAGFSGAIGVLSFGIILANGRRFALASKLIRPGRFASFSTFEHGFLHELIFVLKTFFFIYLGISLQLRDVRMLLIGGVIVAFIYAARHVVTLLLSDRSQPREHAMLVAVMVPKGLAAAALASLPREAGVAGGDAIQSVTYMVVFLSITLTALMIPLQRLGLVQRLYARAFARFRMMQELSGSATSGAPGLLDLTEQTQGTDTVSAQGRNQS